MVDLASRRLAIAERKRNLDSMLLTDGSAEEKKEVQAIVERLLAQA